MQGCIATESIRRSRENTSCNESGARGNELWPQERRWRTREYLRPWKGEREMRGVEAPETEREVGNGGREPRSLALQMASHYGVNTAQFMSILRHNFRYTPSVIIPRMCVYRSVRVARQVHFRLSWLVRLSIHLATRGQRHGGSHVDGHVS